MSATAAEPQGEDNVFSMATEVPGDSPPSPDTDTPSTRSVRSCGEDQSCDLSSDGKYELLWILKRETCFPIGISNIFFESHSFFFLFF